MDDLAKKFSKLSPHAAQIFERLLDIASQQQSIYLKKNHWLMTPELYSLFGLNLAMYHAVTSSPLNKAAFESILVESCIALGRNAEQAKSMTAEIDVVIDGENISLKSEGCIHENILISKFCELGWGPWKKADDLYYKIHQNGEKDQNRTFEHRINIYDRVLTLRNQTKDRTVEYELLEIPLEVFRRVLEIPLSDYKREMRSSRSKTKPKTFSIRIPWSKEKGAREIVVKFDGGGERKLTVKLPKECSTLVAEWKVTSKLKA